jgi:protein SCO1/2
MAKTPEQQSHIRRFTFAVVGALILMTGMAFVAIRNGPPMPAPLPDLGRVPLFHLTDQTGAPFAESSLHGRVWIANFIFTRCPDICPLFTQEMANVEGELADLTNVRYVSFSVDPDYDTPERLAAFAKEHHATSRRWSFVTGKSDDIQKVVVDGFKISLNREGHPDAGKASFVNIVHGVHFILVDQQGVIRGYYDSKDPERVKLLIRDARRLADPGAPPRGRVRPNNPLSG